MRMEEVCGQPTWSFGWYGLWLRRVCLLGWELGHSNEVGKDEQWGIIPEIHKKWHNREGKLQLVFCCSAGAKPEN